MNLDDIISIIGIGALCGLLVVIVREGARRNKQKREMMMTEAFFRGFL
jgi:hypothetical protein